jgi:hypothetical protein
MYVQLTQATLGGFPAPVPLATEQALQGVRPPVFGYPVLYQPLLAQSSGHG